MIESPIIYMGSKYKLLDRLIPLFPQKQYFIDMFTGGGSVYMNVAHLYKYVGVNDLLINLIDIHKNLKNSEFIQEAAELSISTKDSKDAYLDLRESYNSAPSGEKLLALIWSCNSNMMRFNNSFKFNQTWGRRGYNRNTAKKISAYMEHDYSNVIFRSGDFSRVMIEHPEDTFVYMDPPYSNTEAGYNAFWSNEDEDKLIKLVDSYIDRSIAFGLSGVINNKPNRVYEHFKSYSEDLIHFHYFEDLYKKISKKDKINTEYYITNV